MGSAARSGHDDTTAGRIKVWVKFVPREGWLPYDTEGLWATPLEEGTARVDNVPFLVNGIAQGDVVRFATGADGLNWATERLEWSGNSTIRVLPAAGGPLGPDARAVYDLLAPFGVGGETYSAELPLIAFNIPSTADLAQIKALLVRGADEGWWGFEAACVGPAWEGA
jgi:hypothetical protein